MATNPRYPKVSTQNLIRSSGFDFDVPSPLSQAVGRRMTEQQAAEAKLADMNMSPLNKAVSALKATASMGTMLFQAIQQAPKALQGEDAYTEAIGNRAYIPEDPKALEYMGDFGNMLERLETEYKIPPLMPELIPFQPLANLATSQAARGVAQGATRAGMAAERALDKPVTDVMNRGGRGAEMLGSFATNPAQVIKPKGGNWLGGNLIGNFDKDLSEFKSPKIAGETSAQRIPKHEALLNDPTLNQDQIDRVRYQLELTKGDAALDNWIERNVSNYVKKEMGTPEDPVRLMMDKRAQEIEAQFQVDMNRAQRTRARAETEEDLRRKVNLTRQAQREEEQAKFDRDFAMDYVTHLPKEEDRLRLNSDSEILDDLQKKRTAQGFPAEGMAQSDPAKRWENISDEAIEVTPARKIQGQREKYSRYQAAEKAHADLWNQISDEYLDQIKKIVTERGADITDEQLIMAADRVGITDKAKYLGKEEELRNLSSDMFNARRESSEGYLQIGEENPFVSKLDPETNLYSAYIGDLGIDHVIDVIRQDVEAGRIRPEQLNKLSMDQAIKRTAEFNMDQAKKMQETTIKNMEGFPTYKDYGDEGYKWIELKAPEAQLEEGHTLIQDKPTTSNWKVIPHPEGEGYALRADNGQMALNSRGITERKWNTPEDAEASIPDYAEIQEPDEDAIFKVVDQSGNVVSVGATEKEALKLYKRQEREQQLADALKYEGDTMGHCVGGYCPDVLEGKSRIYSLRDKRGEPHVTVEVNPASVDRGTFPVDTWFKSQPKEVQDAITEAGYTGYNIRHSPQFKEAQASAPASIRQIKGKQNAAPKEDYLPYVQDFVRSGQWSDVGDFKNTGLVKQDGKYMTQAEYDDYLLNELKPPEPPVEGMKAGGRVHISDNPDSMMMELEDRKFAGGGAILKKVLAIGDHAERAVAAQNLLKKMESFGPVGAEERRALLKAQSGARSLPTVLPRAYPKTKEQIRGYAQRTADQLNAAQQGQFLREDPTGASVNAAGKSKKQWEMEQGLTHDIKPLGLPLDPIKTANIEDQLGMLKMGITGDTSISDQVLHRAGQYALQKPSEQQGGAFFGLRKRVDPAAWASNVPVLENVQRDVGEFSRAYGDVPVIGQYNSMNPQGTNFAQHFADANLEAIDVSRMTPDQLEQANNLIKMGNEKSGAFPDFPGLQDPSGAYFYFSFFPELRKHFNDIMTKPDFTSKLGLPDGRVILHAISDPELRDMPVLTSGRAQYQLVPDQDPKNLPLSEHSTYTHNLPRDRDAPVTRTPFPVPAEMEFSDVTEYAQPRYKPSEMTRVMQTAAPRQIVDQQHIDEIKTFEDFMRQYSPQSEKKKAGGLIKVKRKAGGGIIKKAIKSAGKAAEAPATKRLEMSFKDVAKPVPELTEASQKLKAGQLSREEYEALVNKHKPVTPYNFVPQPATAEDANRALNVTQRTKFGKVQDIAPGTPTGLRLDINAYKDHGVWVNSIHPKDMPTTYNNVSSVTNADMVMPEDKALEVATREKNKSPFAVIRGGWNPINEEEAVAKAQEYLNHPDWVQVGIDPERHGYYYNRATMEPIIRAEEVIQIGPLVLAKNPVTAPKELFKYARGGAINAEDLILTERPL